MRMRSFRRDRGCEGSFGKRRLVVGENQLRLWYLKKRNPKHARSLLASSTFAKPTTKLNSFQRS